MKVRMLTINEIIKSAVMASMYFKVNLTRVEKDQSGMSVSLTIERGGSVINHRFSMAEVSYYAGGPDSYMGMVIEALSLKLKGE